MENVCATSNQPCLFSLARRKAITPASTRIISTVIAVASGATNNVAAAISSPFTSLVDALIPNGRLFGCRTRLVFVGSFSEKKQRRGNLEAEPIDAHVPATEHYPTVVGYLHAAWQPITEARDHHRSQHS